MDHLVHDTSPCIAGISFILPGLSAAPQNLEFTVCCETYIEFRRFTIIASNSGVHLLWCFQPCNFIYILQPTYSVS